MPTTSSLQKQLRPAEVYLRRLVSSDKEKICQWMASAFILHHSFVVLGPHALSKDFGSRAYAERYFNLLMSDERRETYAIIANNQHIGTVGIKEILCHERAECFIEIGEKEYRGQGLGRAAMSNLLEIAFEAFSLELISLDVLEFNTAALKLYYYLGFVSENNYAWHYDEFGLYWRVIHMSLSKKDWSKRSH